MSRNLRNFNDTYSIRNWAHTMSILKNLLLPSQPPPAPQLIRQPPPTQNDIPEPARSITPPHTISFQPAMMTCNQQNTNPRRSITPQTPINFQPTATEPLTQSPARCSWYVPREPSPLTIHTHCWPNVSPSDTLPPCPKRRKLDIPPSVDYHASTTNSSYITRTSLPTSKTMTTCTSTRTKKYAWVLCRCPNSGRFYFWNQITEAVQDTAPAGYVSDPVGVVKRKIYPT